MELELDMDSDSENEGALPCWDDEDRQFFSEGDSSCGYWRGINLLLLLLLLFIIIIIVVKMM